MIDVIWFDIFSELFVNLSAGWFGAALVTPNFSGIDPPFNFFVLTGDVLVGIFRLPVAFRLRKPSREKK